MDEATPLVSVIMSVHNGEQWLKEAIDSILRQTWPNWELWIVDDASDDSTWQILESYIRKPPDRISIIRQDPKQGLTKNLNMILPFAQGEFIARMDADDISEPDRLAKQVAFLRQNPSVDVVASFISLIDQKGQAIRTVWEDDRKTFTNDTIKAMLPSRNCIAHPSIMMRGKLLRTYCYNEAQTHSQDWDLWLRLANDGKIIEKIQAPLLLYRVHDSSITSTSNKKSAFRKKHEFYQRYLATAKPGPITTKVRKQYQLNRVKLFLSTIKRKLTS